MSSEVVSADIVIPVYNEENSLPRCLDKLLPFCRDYLTDYRWRVIIADNGSTDATYRVANELQRGHPDEVAVVHLDQKGRGRSLKRAWSESDADVRAYMDVDLSTDLSALRSLLNAVRDGHDVATGSRLMRGSRTSRSFKREVISRVYNLIIKTAFWNGFSDAQCGFKAVSRRVVQDIVPLVRNDNWFFDTELLLVAEKNGYGIADIPVTWMEDADTRVKIAGTVFEDLRGLARLRFGGIPKAKRSEE